jgi:hypothetical protein
MLGSWGEIGAKIRGALRRRRLRPDVMAPASDFANRVEIRVHGLQRSGNHAILHWIASQCQGPVVLLNDCRSDVDPFESMQEYVEYDRGSTLRTVKSWEDGAQFERSIAPQTRDTLIYTYEDCALSASAREQAAAWLGPSAKFIDLLIIRDPFNFFASRLAKWGQLTGVQDKNALVALWKGHAAEAVGPRVLLDRNTVVANFSLWAESRAYRRNLARALQLEFTDRGVDEMVRLGPGSSFDGFRYAGDASKMAVNGRWKHYVEDDMFRSIICDREIERLSTRLFSGMKDWRFMRRLFGR